MAKYFSVEEMECKCCGQLPDDGIDERLQNVLDAILNDDGRYFYCITYSNARTRRRAADPVLLLPLPTA